MGLGVAILAARPIGALALGVPAPTPLWIVGLAALTTLLLGVGAGIWPARQASRIPPAEALRES